MRPPIIDNQPPTNFDRLQNPSDAQLSTRFWEWVAGVVLFLGTALVVVCQNSHLAVLWDLSYVLDHCYRIALGDVPYRDFPFVHAPLTFLVQAAIIKLTGRVFWHHVLYCALAGGLGTVLSWRILRNVLGATNHARSLAFLLSLPLIPLGIYSVFPHPFYDPDCTLAILISILLLQQIERKPSSILLPFLAGASLVIPVFVKQNTGVAFLAGAIVSIVSVTVFERARHRSVRRYVLTIVGAAATFALAIFLIHLAAGLKTYWHWTIQFAAERRTPTRGEMLGIYTDKMILVWLALIAAGVVLLWFNRQRHRVLMALSALLISIPFIWPAIYLLRDSDPSERAERLLNVWPVLLIVSFIVAVLTIKRRTGISLILPFLLIAAINGCFMPQQLWGSTYAIWPLFMILLATSLAGIAAFAKEQPSIITLGAGSAIVLSLLIAGSFYVRSHERLSYANLDEGELKRSNLPQLRGLATRGEWIPTFEELVRYADREIPRDEGILILPGEDPFYYATGRRPQFPVLLFDHTLNPYSPEQILSLCRERNIKWLIVKQDLQNEDDALSQEEEKITEALEQDFEQVESLSNYDIYRRVIPGQEPDDNANK